MYGKPMQLALEGFSIDNSTFQSGHHSPHSSIKSMPHNFTWQYQLHKIGLLHNHQYYSTNIINNSTCLGLATHLAERIKNLFRIYEAK